MVILHRKTNSTLGTQDCHDIKRDALLIDIPLR